MMTSADGSRRPPGDRQTHPTILVVDDEEAIRLWLERALECCGYHVVSAADPDAAVRCFEGRRVDAVILDLRLRRGRSGLEVLEFVRGHEGDAHVPVIMLTGVSALTPEEEDKIRKHGASIFYKPEGVEAITAQLERLL